MSWAQQTPYQGPPGSQYGSQPPPGQGNYQPGSQPYGQVPPGQVPSGQGSYGAGAPPGGYGAGAPPGGFGAGAPPGGYGAGAPPGGYGAGAPPGGYGASAPPGGYGSGSPPGGYGAGPGQSGYGGGAPPYAAQQGSTYNAPAGPPPGVAQELWDWFRAVDTDKSGQITAKELQQALCNGNWTPFNAETCRLMIGMFDRDRNGTINIQEFAALWKYIQDWKACFDRFDTDRSGNINATELANAFRSFGYNLSMNFVNVCMRTYDTHQRGSINFDNFIQCCVLLKSLTDQFRMRDAQQNGTIRIQYEEFLKMVLDTC